MSGAQTWRRRFLGVLGVTSAAFMAVATVTVSPAQAGEIRGAGAKDAVAGSYIVVLKDGVSTSAAAERHGGTVTHTYRAALKGYAATMSEAQARRAAADPAVAYVEQDRVVRAAGTQAPTPSWGLDRIDQRALPLDNGYTYPSTASGVTAYVLDTGIRTTHSDFGGRAVWGTNTIDRENRDCSGHGTHAAGVVGGTTYGVAKGVRLVAVKVLDCIGDGTASSVAAGIDWVTAHHTSGPAVANVSLSTSGAVSGPIRAMEDAVRNSIADGVTYAIASGNSTGGSDACGFSPARVTEAITVNEADRADIRTYSSNYGPCTDLFAPGAWTTSAWHSSDTATWKEAGTSVAAAHVSGAAALYLAANPSATPAAVQTALKSNATKGVVSDTKLGTPNNLLYIGNGQPTPPPPGCYGTNGTRLAIPADYSPVYSDITITNCFRNASASSRISVDVRGAGPLVELVLIAPDGSRYWLKQAEWGGTPYVLETYQRDLSAEAGNGTWRLEISDAFGGDFYSWQLVV